MTVDPHTAKHRHTHDGRPYYFCSAGCREKFVADPARYLEPEPRIGRACPGRHDLHLPDASRDPAAGPRLVPDLRHGARAGARDGRRGAQSRARRHDAAVLDRPGADGAGVRARDGRAPDRTCINGSASRPRTGSSSCSRRRSCCGPAGRSSSAAGPRSRRAISTCSR